MRLTLAAAVALVALVAVSARVEAAPRRGLVTIPSAVVFWNAHDGLLALDRCRRPAYGTCVRGTIELTRNGGRSYRVLFRTRAPIEALQTLGRRGAIVVADRAWRTTDRGRTWQRWDRHPGGSREIATDSWPTPRTGFATFRGGGRVSLLVTGDGGRSWKRRRGPCQATTTLIDFPTPRLGWLVCLGEPGAGNEEKAFFRTRDGGRTWRAGAVTRLEPRRRVRGGVGVYGYPLGISFTAGGFGLLWESRGTLYVTRDGGMRWRAEPQVVRPEIDFGRGAAALPGGRGFVLLGRGGGLPARLIETRDYGRTWHVVRRWRS